MFDIKEIIAKYILDLPPYPKGREWRGEENLIRISANENSLGPSPKVLDAISKALKDINRYPDGTGINLKEKLAQNLNLSPENIILGNGSNEIIELAVRTFSKRGAEVLLPEPTFAYYRIAAQAQGMRCIPIPLLNFKINLAGMAKKVTSRTRLIFLSNPNNPTGTIFTRSEFEDFLAHLTSHIVVFIDEAYGEYVVDSEYPLYLDYMKWGKWIITAKTFSKFYGLAGLRIGYGLAREDLIEQMGKVRQPFNVNFLALVGAKAALEDEDHRKKTATMNREGKQYLYRELSRLGLSFITTEANFILIHFGAHAPNVMERLLKERIVVRSMEGYGLGEFLRATIGLPEENMRFIQALEKWKKSS
jgi:histidinol-phosphate aminotransferase